MKVRVAKSAGFCVGVKRAIDIALKTASTKKDVYVLGDIVHNEDVVKQIATAGIKKLDKLGQGKNKVLLVRAHGVKPEILIKARRLGYTVVDATCPMVKEIHKIVREADKQGFQVIVVGDKKHEEVHGIVGQTRRKILVIDNLKDIPFKKIKPIKKACVVVQSTQILNKVLSIVAVLKKHIQEVHFINTICKPTQFRQEEIQRMPLENDVMIVIGSKNSANTKRLYEIARSLNKKSYWVASKKDIRKEWFRKAKHVGITAGASTPASITQGVLSFIHQIADNL